jgi:hypothetical protein
VKIIDCEQGSPEWFAARLGLPTASEFATVMRAKGKGENGDSLTRRTYLNKLAGEIITGEPMENYTNNHMERGHEQEDEARKLYAFLNGVEPHRVGFIVNGRKGCSPDSLIGNDGGLEIKSALPHVQIARLLKGALPAEHKAQVQGNIWVAEREWWDFASYCPKLPLFVVRVTRDAEYIKQLSDDVDQFNAELCATVERIRAYEGTKAAA